MIDLKERVRDALLGVCEDVIFGYPCDRITRERLCWRESGNRCFARADGREQLAELHYSVDVFAESTERACALLRAADARLQDIGLRRELAAEQFERDSMLSHITARYRALADAQGRVYQ